MKTPSLFWKIYLTLLLVLALPMLLFGAAELLTRREEHGVREPAGLIRLLDWTLRPMVEAADSLPEGALESWTAETERRSGMRLYVRRGDFSRPAPDWVSSEALSPRRPSPALPVVASVVSASGRTELFAALFPFGPPARGEPVFRELAMLLSALLGAGMSYLLVRNFMKPLRELRGATVRLAGGDFSARVAAPVARRSDEIGELGRSFDWMAERVEEVVLAHKRLLADISHEIRSPLQRMDVTLALAREAENGELPGHLDRLEMEVGRIDAMVEDLLLLSRAEARMARYGEPVEPTALVAGIVEDARFEGRRDGGNVAVEVRIDEPKSLTVWGDPVLLEHALGNVVRNAVRYAPDGTAVEIDLTERDGRVEIAVADRGTGVAGDELEKIFLPWYRTEASRAKRREGTGLGLSISKRIVESHDGTIEAANRPGGGLIVTLRLPLHRTVGI